MKTSTDITRISRHPVESTTIHSFSIDIPKEQDSFSGLYFVVAGWVIGAGNRVLSVEIVHNAVVLCRVPVSLARHGVKIRHPYLKNAENCGFRARVNALGLPKHFNITLRAVLKGRSKSERVRVPLVDIEGTHSQLPVSYTPKRQPLLITALGRSGTTWLMRLLSGDYEIAAVTSYPYEVRVGVYWMQTLQVLSSPGNHEQSTRPDAFEANIFNIGSCPYYHPAYMNRLENGKQLNSWFSNDYIEQLASFSMKSIDQYYDVLAGDKSPDKSRFFMEKNLGGHIPRVYSNIYDSPKEIILIRDFRDMFCSSRAFNEKRGFAAFGQQLAASDEEWIRNRYIGARKLVQSWKEREEHTLLLRYEDLILKPEESLNSVFEYLEMDIDPGRPGRLLDMARKDTPELRAHRTTADPVKSIGRWKRDMNSETKELFNTVFDDILSELGYS